ncbi:MAG: hypothetical protein KDD70_16785, partial [Bdellovibrionales bacterium]|nr:hypothetical protein [Bdellovibrionales bacterium]
MPNKAAEQVNIVLESDAANSPTSLSEEELALLRTEEEILERTLASLQTQLESRGELLKAEDFRSRELTAELVAATRDEDKQMLASDEAVSHALKQNHSGEAKSLTRLLEKPYFARFVVEEEDRGRTKTVEYKIGHASNPDCRIIDWRKSPLAKLYYEYQEGEEFCEEIQGTEREGTIVLRHPVRIEDGILKSVTTRFGTFSLVNGDWTRSSMRASGKGGIRSVLPLITPDQFRTITEDAKTAVLIQGIAGSGKTTVALHRLAWLLHENNSEFGAEDCAVIVRNEVLGEFIKHTLDAIDIEGVSVFTFAEWREKVCRLLAPEIRIGRFNRAGLVESSLPPKGLTIFLHSEQYFEFFEAAIKEPQSDTSVSTFWNITKNVMTSAASGGGTYSALGLDLSAISRYLDTCAEQSY